MANWFYIDNFGTKQGPITQDELTSFVQQGVITPQTQLEDESGRQGAAGQVNGLFPQQPLQFGQPPYPPPQSTAKLPKDYLVWSIITTVCCFPVLGIIAIIFSVQAKSAFQIGDYAGYESKTKVAFWCNLIGLIVGILGLIVMIGVQLALLLPAVSAARGAAMRMQCANHEKQIMLAIHNYHDVYNGLPPLYTVDDDGKPLHSWRVLILPFIEHSDLYEKIHLDEPWDSEYNKQFHDQVISVYRCPSRPLTPGTCTYSAIAGGGLIPICINLSRH
ncbi:hypothetical protein FACS1894170_11020 [Planctomycetales bacterium]|nr:hypothetical protein FACS1894170_11020 [Planctomycetales bacterium]